MQETVPQTTRTQYSILDLLVVVLIFGSHMALMTQHYMAGVDYALTYTCFAIGVTLVLFILSQRKLEAARAHRPVAFFACAFLVFAFFHWVAPSTTSPSPANRIISSFVFHEALPSGTSVHNSSSSSSQGSYTAVFDSMQSFEAKGLTRAEVLNRIVSVMIEKLKAHGISISVGGSLKSGMRDSQSIVYWSHGWRGRLTITCSNEMKSGDEPMYSLEIKALEIRR